MKKIIFTVAAMLMLGAATQAQDSAHVKAAPTAKPLPASPPATVTNTIKNGTVVTINYAQPGVKGRTIGKEIAPWGKVWRTGANAATQFIVSNDVKINGKTLPAGKYGLFTIPTEGEWTIIFNKTWDQWGSYKYNEQEDALRIKVKPGKTASFVERMTFFINENGLVSLQWGDIKADFTVK